MRCLRICGSVDVINERGRFIGGRCGVNHLYAAAALNDPADVAAVGVTAITVVLRTSLSRVKDQDRVLVIAALLEPASSNLTLPSSPR